MFNFWDSPVYTFGLDMLAAACLVACALVVAAAAARPAALDRGALERQLSVRRAVSAPLPAPRYFTQAQDHFDGANPNTWQQAYYVNDQYWVPGSAAPVFVCVGGEGPPLDGSVVVASVHCNDAVELLPRFGALLVALEHRYYGCHNMSACPVASFAPGADANPRRFLSSRQALGDLAAFHAHLSAIYSLDSARNPFVSFGGSYPGMLAGWFRTKFPHLVHAAVSSSAPVFAQVEMRGYNDVVAAAFAVADNGVGGSAACRDAIVNGHAAIGAAFATDAGRARLAKVR
jgi:serine protease 16